MLQCSNMRCSAAFVKSRLTVISISIRCDRRMTYANRDRPVRVRITSRHQRGNHLPHVYADEMLADDLV